MAKLKVYRTAIGFHDAYVAAPSKKAALEAWGTTKDLFARGAAEIVVDSKLTEAPLAEPGKVIKVLRELPAEEPVTAPARAKKATSGKAAAPEPKKPKPKPKPKPRPNRAALNAAEQALDDLATRQQSELAAIDEKVKQLQRERRDLVAAQEREVAKLDRKRGAAEAKYQAALSRWQA